MPTQDFPTVDAASVAALLAELAGIPSTMLPGETRGALAEAIRTGEIDGLYRPFGSTTYNATFSALAPYVDPRTPLAAWVAHWQAGRSPSDAQMAASTAAQAHAWQDERQRLQNGGQPR